MAAYIPTESVGRGERGSTLLGTPTESDLEFVRNEEARNYIRQFNPHPRQPLHKVFQHVNPLAIDLVDRMLTFDPTKRITENLLSHGSQQTWLQDNVGKISYIVAFWMDALFGRQLGRVVV
ncbi:mitogen-activated protein kinase 3 [Tripterygium wilfordii]|uniref:Mitogen-activated protein kinase 3 n=1 Tax=Tripterygium wilfordii TaxID=458696 RepID=A0A7J7DEC0_TRIWF|nr:mitogen-activated protein kinase 3 [Tripterygium wilfordii]